MEVDHWKKEEQNQYIKKTQTSYNPIKNESYK